MNSGARTSVIVASSLIKTRSEGPGIFLNGSPSEATHGPLVRLEIHEGWSRSKGYFRRSKAGAEAGQRPAHHRGTKSPASTSSAKAALTLPVRFSEDTFVTAHISS